VSLTSYDVVQFFVYTLSSAILCGLALYWITLKV
jgi:hypothetical protein